jgi:hypothetical protein
MQSDIRARIQDIILGEYIGDYPIAQGRFHLAATSEATLATHDLGTLERAVSVDIPNARTPLVPVDRGAGFGLYQHTLTVRVGYVLTGAGDAAEGTGEQSGAGTLVAIQDRANEDRQALESALGSWRNLGGLSPHVIDLEPVGGGGVEVGTDRCILAVPFVLKVRVPL